MEPRLGVGREKLRQHVGEFHIDVHTVQSSGLCENASDQNERQVYNFGVVAEVASFVWLGTFAPW